MKAIFLSTILFLPLSAQEAKIPNPAIDYAEFARLTSELAPVREKNRVTEEQFIKMVAEPGTVVLDARTRGWFERIHVKGAHHLVLTDFTADALREIIPDKNTRILIYCNNNFENESEGFARKLRSVSLNIQTFINLHAYGYENVYELGPLLDVNTTKIPLVRNINFTPLPRAQERPTWKPVPAPE
jgi:phage shock protein E